MCRPHPTLGKPRSRAERKPEPPRRVEPAAGSRGQSRGGGGGAPEGEKESAAESKRLVGEGCQDLDLLGSAWTRARKEAVAGHPAPIPSLSRSPLGWPRKVSLALQGRVGLEWPAAVTRGSRILIDQLLQPFCFTDGKTDTGPDSGHAKHANTTSSCGGRRDSNPATQSPVFDW